VEVVLMIVVLFSLLEAKSPRCMSTCSSFSSSSMRVMLDVRQQHFIFFFWSIPTVFVASSSFTIVWGLFQLLSYTLRIQRLNATCVAWLMLEQGFALIVPCACFSWPGWSIVKVVLCGMQEESIFWRSVTCISSSLLPASLPLRMTTCHFVQINLINARGLRRRRRHF